MATRRDDARVPWKRERPAREPGDAPKTMTHEERSAARTRAALAGRPYPNLVDNLAVIRARRTKTS